MHDKMNGNGYTLFIFLLLMAIATVACDDSERMQQMRDADAMIDRRSYDSAIARLNTIDTTRLTDREWAYYHLLDVTAKLKDDIPIKTDSVINKVIDYYNRHGSGYEKARAYLCKASYFADKDSLEGIVRNLKIAEQHAESTPLQYEVTAKIASCNLMSLNYTSALEHARKGLELAGTKNDSRWQGVYYYILMRVYWDQHEEDSVKKYVLLLENTLYAQPRSEFSRYSYYISDYAHKHNANEKAIKLLRKSIEIDPQCANYYLLATIYDEENRSEEAEKMWQEALKEKKDYLKAPIMEEYSAWLQRQGRMTEAAQITEEARKLNEIVKSKNYQKQERILKVQTDFDKTQEVEKKQKAVVIVSVAAMVMIALIILVWTRRYRKNKRNTSNLEETISNLNEEIQLKEDELVQLKHTEEQLKAENSSNKNKIKSLSRSIGYRKGRVEEMKSQLVVYENIKSEMIERGRYIGDIIRRKDPIDALTNYDMASFLKYMVENQNEMAWVRSHVKMYSAGKIQAKTLMFIVLLHFGYEKEDVMTLLKLKEGTYRIMKSRYA